MAKKASSITALKARDKARKKANEKGAICPDCADMITRELGKAYPPKPPVNQHLKDAYSRLIDADDVYTEVIDAAFAIGLMSEALPRHQSGAFALVSDRLHAIALSARDDAEGIRDLLKEGMAHA